MMDNETLFSEFQELLYSVAKLYSSTILNITNRRVGTYHTQTNTDYADEIGDALESYISQVKDQATSNQSGVHDPGIPPEMQRKHTTSPNSQSGVILDSALSEFFKKNMSYSKLSSPLEQKLKTTAWDHTHSAIRYAHMGDYTCAKLHADLANSAIHELGHYMDEKDFISFKQAVSQELQRK